MNATISKSVLIELDENNLVEINQDEIKELAEIVEQFSQWGKLSLKNLERMKTLQKIMLLEEGKDLTIDEVLTRLLEFYRIFVPYSKKQFIINLRLELKSSFHSYLSEK